jgi:hypothetical protein
MNPVGKPDAGNPHVRFDERGRETEPLAKRLTATAPFLDSTVIRNRGEERDPIATGAASTPSS